MVLRFRKAGRTLAVATIFRGHESLLAELAMEKGNRLSSGHDIAGINESPASINRRFHDWG